MTVCQVITTTAQKKDAKWIDNVYKAIVTVETTTKEGMTKTGPGFLIRENGEAIATYELFRNAGSAVIITATGEKLPVTHILGADEMYNVIRFKAAVPKKTAFLPIANFSPALHATVFLPPSKEEKDLTQGDITEISKMSSAYDYYQIDMPLPPSQVGFPLLTATGEVFAMAQADASGKGKTYGIALSYIQSLQVTATDIFKKTYADIGIRRAWDTAIEDAQIALMLYASQQDAAAYLETLNDFIATFPNDADSYISRANHYAFRRKELAATENEQLQMLDKAMNDLDNAAKIKKNKGDAYFNKARLIFGIIVTDSLLSYKNWNMRTVEENIQKAIKDNNNPAYRQFEGELAFFLQDYEKAYASFSLVNQSPASSGTSYYYAAKSKQHLEGATILEIISLLDSAILKSPLAETADYLLENIELKLQLGLYEQVIKDYDKYFLAMGGNVTDVFYHYRQQAKLQTGDLEGALVDIDRAIIMDNTNAVYYAEKASVYLRMNDIQKAQTSVEKAIALDADFASSYRILGVCYLRQENKPEACIYFHKAKELGDPLVERLINEHCN